MEIQIWTIALSQWREAKVLNIPLLDITAKSGIKAFSPDFNLVIDYKEGIVDEIVYEASYLEKMRYSLRTHPDIWNNLLTINPKIAIACYCRAGRFCHRHLFRVLMEKYLVTKGHTVQYMGEIEKK